MSEPMPEWEFGYSEPLGLSENRNLALHRQADAQVRQAVALEQLTGILATLATTMADIKTQALADITADIVDRIRTALAADDP